MSASNALHDLVLRLSLVSERNLKVAIMESEGDGGSVWTALFRLGLLSSREVEVLLQAERGEISLKEADSFLREASTAQPGRDKVSDMPATPILNPRLHGHRRSSPSASQSDAPKRLPSNIAPVPLRQQTPTPLPKTERTEPPRRQLRPTAPAPAHHGGIRIRDGADGALFRDKGGAVPAPRNTANGAHPSSCSGLLGMRLGRYQLSALLGRGACGSVFLAQHEKLNIPVAIKVLEPNMVREHPEFLDSFMAEARAAAVISHPNVVRVLDCDEIEGFHIIVMEYVDGMSMLELIQMNGLIIEDRALAFAKQVADGLESALNVGIIHRDIKPANILVTKSKQVKLADLGLAKRIDDPAAKSGTNPNVGLGTPNYFAPEQALNAALADHRSDIYALGSTLFHMLTGQVPFPGRSVPEIVHKHINEPVRQPNSLVGVITPESSRLVMKMMSKRPQDRYQSYPELISAMEECIVIAKRRDLITRDSSTSIPTADLRSAGSPRRGIFNLFSRRGGDS